MSLLTPSTYNYYFLIFFVCISIVAFILSIYNLAQGKKKTDKYNKNKERIEEEFLLIKESKQKIEENFLLIENQLKDISQKLV